MERYFIYLSYNGKNYCGWQIQPNGISIQQRLEETLSTLLRKETEVVGAGRTDAGVHARLMVAHFDSPSPIADTNFLGEKMNRFLPKDIAVHKIVKVKPDAHARFDALSRTYNYILTQKKNPFNFEFAYFYPSKLNFEQMNEACLALFNYTDFTSFSKLHTDVKTNNCTIYKAEWKQSDDCWIFTIKANRFLRNMVRAIVGTLLDVGRGKLTIDEFCRIIEAKNRCKAGSSVPGHALYLTDIEYPDELFI